MGKPLELHIYERNADGDYIDTPAENGRCYVIAQELVDVYAMEKRLTDAELAAEMWRSSVEFFTTPYGPERGEWARRNGILERFATHPYYDETP